MKGKNSLDCLRKGQDFWYDADKDKHYLLKDGTITACNSMGVPFAQFVLYKTGCYNYNDRINHSAGSSITDMYLQWLSTTANKRVLQKKFTGYTQFPRPASTGCNYTGNRIKINSRPFTSKTQFQVRFNGERSPLTSRRAVIRSSPCLKKNFLTSKQKSALAKSASNHRARSSTNSQKYKNEQHSLINSKKSSSISLKNKTYKDVVEKLKWEEETIEGCKPPTEKPKRQGFSKLFEVHVASEVEIYEREQQRRKLMNPKMYTELIKKEQIDRQLFLKRQQLKREKAVKNQL